MGAEEATCRFDRRLRVRCLLQAAEEDAEPVVEEETAQIAEDCRCFEHSQLGCVARLGCQLQDTCGGGLKHDKKAPPSTSFVRTALVFGSGGA